MPRWTDEHLEIVERMRTVQGLPHETIAEVVGRTVLAVESACRDHGWLLPPDVARRLRSKHSDELVAEARKLWDAGVSTKDIGDRLGIGKNALIGIAHRQGFAPREKICVALPPGERTPRRPRAPRPLPLFGDAQPIRMVAGHPTTQRGPTLLQLQMRSHAGHVARREGIQMRPLPIFGPARSCQFPLWDEGEKPSHKYCGKPVAIGSYCAACHAVTHRAGTALYPAWVR